MDIGLQPPTPFQWPDNALVAVTVTVGFEAFTTSGHFGSPSRMRKPGKPDHLSLSFADYAYKVGIWRIFDVLERNGLKATFDCNGLAAERYPVIVHGMHTRGHETAGHGWSNEYFPDDEDLDGERRDIRNTVAAIEAATGERPVGWVGPGSVGTAKTLEILVDEGFLWSGDDASDDVPFIQDVNGEPLVILPRTNFATNDLRVWLRPSNSPLAYWDGFKEAFDFCYAEGQAGYPKWVDLIIHPDIGARPAMIGVIERAMKYTQQHEGIWYARRRDMAEWTMKRYGEGVS